MSFGIRVLNTEGQVSGAWRTVEPVTVEELKALQVARVNNHRPQLVERLKTYEANGLYNLAEKHYRDYKRFLLTLKP